MRFVRALFDVPRRQLAFVLAGVGIVIGLGSMAWDTHKDKLRQEAEAIRVRDQAAAVERVSITVINLCAMYHSNVLMPAFTLPDPVAPENNFGRGASGLAFEVGIARILAERGQPVREDEKLFDKDGIPYAVVAERVWTDPARWKGEWVYVFAIVKASACGADLVAHKLQATDSVFLDFNFTRFPDGTVGPRPNV